MGAAIFLQTNICSSLTNTKMSTYFLLFPSKQRCSKFKTQFRGAGTCCHEWPSANIDRGGGGGEETSLGKVCFCLPGESEPLSAVCDASGGGEIRPKKRHFLSCELECVLLMGLTNVHLGENCATILREKTESTSRDISLARN